MPRLSMYREEKGNDFRFIDRTMSEMYVTGGVSMYIHKYLGPKTPATATGDATQPIYATQSEKNIQDLLFLENRDRSYSPDVYVMRGIYNVQDIDFDLSQFGLFLNNDTLFITFHLQNMVDNLGRKLMNGDVLELPHLKDYYSLDSDMPAALKRFYVVTDAARPAEGFSATWYPHLWRVKCTPLVDSREYADIIGKVGSDGSGGSGSLKDLLSTYKQDIAINDAIITQAEQEVKMSGYDVDPYFVVQVADEDPPADQMDVNHDTSWYELGSYLTGDGVPPNAAPVTPGVAFPTNPATGDFCLRLDYFPNRLFKYNGRNWIKIEDDVRTQITSGPMVVPKQLAAFPTVAVDGDLVFRTDQNLLYKYNGTTWVQIAAGSIPGGPTQRSSFVNNLNKTLTADRGYINERQSLSDALRPKEDNGG